MAKPREQRTKNVAALFTGANAVPKQQQVGAVRTAKAIIAVAARAERKEAPSVNRTVKEPNPIFWWDKKTQTTWVVKPDEISMTPWFVGVDDTKTGKHRHRYAEIVPFMMGLVVRETKAWKAIWGVDFEGTVKTRLKYMRGADGRWLPRPEYSLDAIGDKLTRQQEARLQGITGFIREMDDAWNRGWFRVQPGDHCQHCNYRNDCPLGKKWMLDHPDPAATALQAPDQPREVAAKSA
jgi:hypothetical protein